MRIAKLEWEGRELHVVLENITCIRKDGDNRTAIHFVCSSGFPGCPVFIEKPIDEVMHDLVAALIF